MSFDIIQRLRPDTENLPPWFLAELRSVAARCRNLSPAERRALAHEVLSPQALDYLRGMVLRARIAHRMLTETTPQE